MEQPSAEFLNSNFEYLASLDPPGVVRQLPPLHDGGGLLPHDFQLSVPEGAIGQKIVPSIILQVNEVADVSLPLAQRLREIAPTGTDTEGVCTEITEPGSLEETLRSLESKDNSARHHGRRQRLLRLVLTDGFVRVFAVEDCRRGCDALRTGVVLGSKLRLFAPLRLLNGVIILESEKTELLGGFVKEIQSFWEDYAVKKLHELSGRPGRIAQASSATNTNTNTNTATFSSAPAPRIAGDTNHSGVAPGPTQQQHQKQQQRQQQQQQLLEYRHQTNEGVSGPVVQPSPPAAASAQPTPPTRPAARLTPTPEPLSHPRVTQEYFVPATPTPEQPPTATPPFSTAIGKITDVMSDLTIRDGENCSPGEPPSFSLKVLLSVQQPLPPSLDVGEDGAIVVDLGNAWLQRALGMNVASFRSLTSSQLPNDLARINQLVDEVGRTLENFGIAEFHIRRRLPDGILEVVHVRQLE
ncbi:hypothetical protein DPX39_030017300 [Trypanosoma brucei equiperdum]|uniref:RecQ-mediated genome instability protein 1 n=1 Tax=Trypanosoma brucei equiperdum TaxID=630700 RepID=A0A3L6LG59_9TRYP|nr:hypothetical protein DPX39_030017300 [Trypanosoma brucei equiperdum]